MECLSCGNFRRRRSRLRRRNPEKKSPWYKLFLKKKYGRIATGWDVYRSTESGFKDERVRGYSPPAIVGEVREATPHYCRAADCGKPTFEHRPYCVEHSHLLPYYADVSSRAEAYLNELQMLEEGRYKELVEDSNLVLEILDLISFQPRTARSLGKLLSVYTLSFAELLDYMVSERLIFKGKVGKRTLYAITSKPFSFLLPDAQQPSLPTRQKKKSPARRKKRSGRKLTSKLQQEIIEKCPDFTLSQLVDIFGFSEILIDNICKAAGVAPRGQALVAAPARERRKISPETKEAIREKCKDPSLSYAAIGKMYNVSAASVGIICRETKRRRTRRANINSETKKRIIEKCKDFSLTQQEIADMFNVHKMTVSNICREAGIDRVGLRGVRRKKTPKTSFETFMKGDEDLRILRRRNPLDTSGIICDFCAQPGADAIHNTIPFPMGGRTRFQFMSCPACTQLIEDQNLRALVTQGANMMPPTMPRKMARTIFRDIYSTFFTNLLKSNAITPTHIFELQMLRAQAKALKCQLRTGHPALGECADLAMIQVLEEDEAHNSCLPCAAQFLGLDNTLDLLHRSDIMPI
jgi:ribosomal protein L23